MSNADIGALEAHRQDRGTPIQRLLFVADAAVADIRQPVAHA
jgi:hypothetical protein